MAQATRPCKGCGEVIHRTHPGIIPYYCSSECQPRCSVDWCEKPLHGHGYCSAHAARRTRTGDPLTPLVHHPNVGPCKEGECDRPSHTKGWCITHYSQWNRLGEVQPIQFTHGSGGYDPTHQRIRRLLGPASDQTCVDCNGPAAEWSYNHDDPNEKTGRGGSVYSRDPKCYSPRCVLCHRGMDARIRRDSSLGRENGR